MRPRPKEYTSKITSWAPSTALLANRARRSPMLAAPIAMIKIQLKAMKLAS